MAYNRAYYEANRDKFRAYARRYRETHREASRANYMRWYRKKRAEQRAELGPERCAICQRVDVPLHMDHDHARYQVSSRSGWGSKVKYRGLLCNRCNTALPLIEDVRLLKNARAYLRGHQG